MAKINILSAKNGVGLERDANILIDILTAQGHVCRFIDIARNATPRPADINIFCEILRPNYTRSARRNFMIPNPEWFHMEWLRFIPKFEKVLCKTRDAERIFKDTGKAVFTGFTSKDMWIDGITKEKKYLHCAGKSSAKGTDQIVQSWSDNKDFPHLRLLQHANHKRQVSGNVHYEFRRLEEDEYLRTLNSHAFHLCPSTYEGWGHYIHEAMSTGAIVITTDGAPMNEFINGNTGITIPVSHISKQNLADMKNITASGVSEAIKKSLKLSDMQISEMGNNARAAYQANEKHFIETLLNVIS